MYKVFEIDTCFSSYAMDYRLVGAKDKEDLKSHLEDILGEMCTKKEIEDIISSDIEDEGSYTRIKEMNGLFTDEPYKILTSYGYYE